MPSPYLINIVSGQGSKDVLNGTYTVTADVIGYDNLSIDPDAQIVSAGVDTYPFTVAATGTLTLHVTENGESDGPEVAGATFRRCDPLGNMYGDPIVSNASGDAVFPFVPFDADDAPRIYFIQTASAPDHEFDNLLQNTAMTASTATVQIENPEAATRQFTLTNENYDGLPIELGSITLTVTP